MTSCHAAKGTGEGGGSTSGQNLLGLDLLVGRVVAGCVIDFPPHNQISIINLVILVPTIYRPVSLSY